MEGRLGERALLGKRPTTRTRGVVQLQEKRGLLSSNDFFDKEEDEEARKWPLDGDGELMLPELADDRGRDRSVGFLR